MLSIYRTEPFIRILVVTTLVWGFAVPIAHLACGMTSPVEDILCDAHVVTDDGRDDAGDAAPSYTDLQAVVHEVSSHEMHGAHAAAAHETHVPTQAVDREAERRVKCPATEFAARDVRVECCWVDANAIDRRAPLPSLTPSSDLTAALSGVVPAVDVPEVGPIHRTAEAGTSPPVPFRLLFSVFLI